MIDPIKSLCELLSSTPLTAQEVADSIGSTTGGGENNVPLIVKPADRSIKEARVVSEDESDEPAYVELVPAQTLTVRDLTGMFGAYRSVPGGTQPSPSSRVAFEFDESEMPYTVTLIAAYEGEDDHADDGRVVCLTLRRDAR